MFPVSRPRRLRRTAALRDLVRETVLDPGGFVYPLFVRPGQGVRDEIASMPGNYHFSVDRLVEEVGAAMDLPPTEVASVASFYTMFYTQPVGQHVIQVCTNISCSLLGAEHIVNYISRKLGIGVGDTTPDGKFTLLTVECLGSCGTAPMMQVDETYHEDLSEEKVDRVLAELA